MKKAIFYFLFSILYFLSSSAQDSSKYFLKLYGDSGSNVTVDGDKVLQLSDSGYIIVGDKAPNLIDPFENYIFRTDKFGNVIWKSICGDTSNKDEGFKTIIRTRDSNFALTGGQYFTHYISNIVKMDINGNIIWEKNVGDTSFDNSSYCIAETFDGSFLVAGVMVDTVGFWSSYLIKTDSQGNTLWDTILYKHILITDGSSVLYDIAMTPDSGFVLTGTAYQGGLEAVVVLIKLDKDGNVQWNTYYDFWSESQDIGIAVLPAVNGGYIISGTGARDSANWEQAFVMKVNPDRTREWFTYLFDYPGAGGSDAIVNSTLDGRYIATGYEYGLLYPSDNTKDIYLTKIDIDGALIWQRIYGNNLADEYGYYVTATNDSGYIITGRWEVPGGSDAYLLKTNCLGFLAPPTAAFSKSITNNTVQFTNQSDSAGNYKWYFGDGDSMEYDFVWKANPYGLVDTFSHIYKDTGTYTVTLYAGACGEWDTVMGTMRIDSVNTSISNIQFSTFNIQVYPNPANDKLNIKIENGKSGVFELYDIAGRKIMEQRITTPTSQINTVNLSQGIYIYKFTDKERRMARGKIVKQ